MKCPPIVKISPPSEISYDMSTNCENELTHLEQFAPFPNLVVSSQMIHQVHQLLKWVNTFWTISTFSHLRKVPILFIKATKCENEFSLFKNLPIFPTLKWVFKCFFKSTNCANECAHFEQLVNFPHSWVNSHMILLVHELWQWVYTFWTICTFSPQRSEFSDDSKSPPLVKMSLHILNN